MKNILFATLTLLFFSCSPKGVKWDATGTFEATEVTVSSEGVGNIYYLNVEEGDLLDSGKIVGQIDTVQLYLKKLQLEASRSGAISRKQDVAKQIAATQQQIEWQLSEKDRYEKLVLQNAATQKQVDDIVNQILVLRKQLIAQRSTLETSNKGIADDGESIEIQISQIEDQLSKCRIISPITGSVLIRYAEAGEYAQTGKQLFTVADMENIFLRAYITSDQLSQIKIGQKVKVYSDLAADQQREYDGTVEWIAARGEFTPKTIQTREERANMVYAVKIAVKNDGFLKIGMYGEVVL